MELFSNKKTGKYFIYVDEEGKDKVVLVNPQEEVKALERRFFNQSLDGDEDDFLSFGLITKGQIETYHLELSRLASEKEVANKEAAREAWENMSIKQKVAKMSNALEKLTPSEIQIIKNII